jgi:hypothetical protein
MKGMITMCDEEKSTIAPEVLEIIKRTTEEAVQRSVEKLSLRLDKDQEKNVIKTLTQMSTSHIIRIGTEIGTQTALEAIKNEKNENLKKRFDRRLRNTKLLLREYRNLKTFAENATFKKSKKNNALSILEELESYDNEELFVDSIHRSKERTAIILGHIDNMIEIYEIKCLKSKKESEQRKYKAIYHVYIAPEEEAKTVEETAKRLFVTSACIYNDIDDAVRSLTSLIFGIDGLRM